MPGIYVRTLSQLDWFDQEKESLLTIPGSYWLCHKKNIYKFIFRYHRAVKNTMQFSHGRELLKIIRRIIKCHPTQGQQFGTQHLLVTYNCTSWTRQDKMFAIMKFQQRTNAAAFSHAFVLTIRTFCSSEHSLFDLKYPIVKEADAGATFKDLNISLDTEEKIISNVIPAADKVVSSRKDTMCQTKKLDQVAEYNGIEDVLSKALETTIGSNFQDNNAKESAIFRENLDEGVESATTAAEMHFVGNRSIEFYNDIQENKSVKCNNERYEENVEQRSVDCVQGQSPRAAETDEIEITKADGLKEEKETGSTGVQKQNQQTRNIDKYAIINKMRNSLKSLIGLNERPLSDKFDLDGKSMEKGDICTKNSKDNLNDNKETTGGNTDSGNEPDRQYFIEAETEDAKSNFTDQPEQKTPRTEIKTANKDCVPKMNKESNKSVHKRHEDHCNEVINLECQGSDGQHTRNSTSVDDKQSESNAHGKSQCKARKQKSRESERKAVPDKVLRSSNITDLVMEGLMFTIRQDRDSVAVIEQKTKLEVDEVLENSEKVETKAGEKCLLNSSLLRLENLVTMIDSPRAKGEQRKSRHAIGSTVNLSPFNLFPSETVYDVNINDADAGLDKSSVSNYDRSNAMKHLPFGRDSPRGNGEQHESRHAIGSTANLSPFNLFPNGTVYNVNINDVDAGLDKSSVSNYDRSNAKKHYLLDQPRRQHQRVPSSNKSSDSCSASEISTEKYYGLLMESGGDERDKRYNDNTETDEEERDIVPEISASKQVNAGPCDTSSPMVNRNIEEMDKCDKSTRGNYNSPLSNSSLNPSKMSTKAISVTSKESSSIELPRQEANVPKIVSNKTVIIEQMPTALRKVLRHTCRTRRFSSTTGSRALRRSEQKMPPAAMTGDTISEASVLLQEDKSCASPDVANNSLPVEFTINSAKTRSGDDEKSSVTHDQDIPRATRDTRVRSSKRRHETRRTLRRSSKHGSPRKLQDITEEFYYDLLHVHNKDNAIRQRCLRQKQRSLNSLDDVKSGKVRIDMLKFIQDITEGARVVVTRLNIDNKSNLLEKNSNLI